VAGNAQRNLSGTLMYRCESDQVAWKLVLSYPDVNPVLSTLVIYKHLDGVEQQSFSGPEVTRIDVGQQVHFYQVAAQYLWAGVKHLLAGYDHLLFVTCLMLIAGAVRRLLLTLTGFTLGHSITLALASTGKVWVPVVFVEVLIALSIVMLAAEILKNNRTTFSSRHPVYVAALFGLLHGFGFASVLSDLGLPQDMMISALVFFNIGIELGQLFFVVCCWLLFRFCFLKIPAFKVRQAILSSISVCAIGSLSSYWAVDRYLGLL